MKFALLKQLSGHYETSAKTLLDSKQWGAAYHVSGLCVEVSLKACICKKFNKREIPSKSFVSDVYTHDPLKLVRLAGLEVALKERFGISEIFQLNWDLVKNWNIESRYQRTERPQAVGMLRSAFDETEGVVRWIRSHW